MKVYNVDLKLKGKHVKRLIEEHIYSKKRVKCLLRWRSHFQIFYWRRTCFIFHQKEKHSRKLIFCYAFCSQSSIFHMRREKETLNSKWKYMWSSVKISLKKQFMNQSTSKLYPLHGGGELKIGCTFHTQKWNFHQVSNQ